MPILEVKNLKKNFGKLEVLKDISFSLEKGEVLAIIGSSGSGKSTLLRTLNFLEKADGGCIIVNGECLYDCGKQQKSDEAELRKKRLHFGLVFQQFNLFPQYNTLQNITLALNLQSKEKLRKAFFGEDKRSFFQKLGDLPKTIAKYRAALRAEYAGNTDKAKQLIERVGLGDKTYSYPFELSGGQQQRVAIARALALEPDVLCFDEPTSALDPELTGEVLKVIKDLKKYNSTMIVVTHEMEFARDVADRIIFMYDGKIEEEGTPDEVFGNPKSERTKQFIAKY
ncbi:MAG: amino acid ABC transporter ATP-binding protein [Clostridiales bacterium]|jgi:polar amino acid transport system ATP-binding protein|nr:amino acid ABC transporter ATP-binding protein [Clostridiales bacterium]HOB64403.1 amino acid ABC transporter ATP-binding protein [Clostridia bacterium]HOK81599.1 amino acid ABC transporter ATP-binding protein [Clostridia bacterium]HOL60496.1 amino acid ABC transporter ATP-binding protein [Clostridia bacterium]HPO52903.1 amino acid ABC transporter ATP-binding protein [Clostridia bacterium]